MIFCKICSSDILAEYYIKEMMFGTKEKFKYNYCKSCATLQIDEQNIDESKLYGINYYSFSINKNNYFKNFIYLIAVRLSLSNISIFNIIHNYFDLKFLQYINPFLISAGNFLDIGCGNGVLISSLSKIFPNKKFTGIDPYIKNKIKKRKNCIIKKSSLFEIDEKYDIILFNHSFEHMSNPEAVLKKVKSILSDDGIIFIRIPVCDSYYFYKYGINWAQIDAPRHKYLYSEKSINIIMQKYNLRVITNISDSRNFSLIASEMYSKSIPLNSKNSYFRGLSFNLSKYDFYRKHYLSNKINNVINKINFGDQKIFMITHDIWS